VRYFSAQIGADEAPHFRELLTNKKMRTSYRRFDINLDQIIDRARQAPLSEFDDRKLKIALHAMAEQSTVAVCVNAVAQDRSIA
jgi:hypothetical protein